jgi:hypothetical protein
MSEVSDEDARRVKATYGQEWRRQGAHTVGVKRGPRGYYVWVGVDPAQPLPSSQTHDGVDVVFEHAQAPQPFAL